MYNKKAAFHNLGCKVNSYELEAAEQMLKSRGYEIVPFAPGADIYIINTCTVTNIADRKSRQMLHRARAMNPDALVIAMGCYAQTDTEKLEKDPAVDVLLGNNRKGELAEVIEKYERDHFRSCYVNDLTFEREYENLSVSEPGEHIRGFMKVQDGCDQFCSYCIIPYARGRVRSRSLSECVKEARALAQKGCAEVVLSGIHLSSYGKDLSDSCLLQDLIEAVHQVEGIRRIRLGSLEPGIITPDFVRKLKSMEKVCPHFHLSLQSGCDRTLKAMNRRYTTAEYREKCALLREEYDHPSLTTDVITGFPGETEEDFAESYAFVDEMDFFETHIFPFSKRRGTKAEKMDGQLTEAVKKERASMLIALNARKHAAFLEKKLERELFVLIEEEQVLDGERFWTGHTPEYERVAVRSDADLRNRVVSVCPTRLHEACILQAFEINYIG